MIKRITKKISNKIKGIDKFYADLDIEDISLYQKYFLSIINRIDIDNLTNRSQGKKYDQKKIEKSYNYIETTLNKAETDNLKSIFLHVMLEQYIFADVYKREINKDNWLKTVMHRKKIDFFPCPAVILEKYYATDNN